MAGKFNRRWMAGAAKADSKWEGKLRDTIFKELGWQGDKIEYVIPHKYTPDFVHGEVLIESKGRFRESSEARKYKHIRDALLPLKKELVFVFYNPATPMPHAKKRKDGTKLTHGEWADKNGFRWFTEHTVKDALGI